MTRQRQRWGEDKLTTKERLEESGRMTNTKSVKLKRSILKIGVVSDESGEGVEEIRDGGQHERLLKPRGA